MHSFSIAGVQLVGGFNQPLWKMMDFVSWDDDYSQYVENKIHVPNHPNCFWLQSFKIPWFQSPTSQKSAEFPRCHWLFSMAGSREPNPHIHKTHENSVKLRKITGWKSQFSIFFPWISWFFWLQTDGKNHGFTRGRPILREIFLVKLRAKDLIDPTELGSPGLRWFTRPGKHTKSYWKWPFTVSFPIKNGDFP